MDSNIAISVSRVSKTFRIPHEKVTSIRGAFTTAFNGERTYEEFKALDDVSFEVKKGEFFGIIGRNGSGKSTLLKVLAGIYEADKGKVKIDGMISPFLELGIGFNPELSGRDNVYLNATVLGMTQKQIDEKFDAIVAFSELERFIDQKLKNYSSGMQVRLAFSVSIHANREILLMDEVLAVGDSNFQSKCLTEFSRYKELGKTVILVSHDIATVQRYCDRAVLLRNGKIVTIGDAEGVGNAYIYENMSDEENRLRGEQRAEKDLEIKIEKDDILKQAEEIEERNRGSREIELMRIRIFDIDGNSEKNVLVSGAGVVFRVEYSVEKGVDLDGIVIGLGIHLRENNQYCFALNSFVDAITLSSEMIARGYVDIEIPKLILNNGEYVINSIVSRNKINLVNPIHFLGGIKRFSVRNTNYNEGLFLIDHNWR